MARRAPGTGSIIARPGGRFEARYAPPGGRPRSAWARSEREALQKLTQLIDGTYPSRRRLATQALPGAQTLTEFAAIWLRHCAVQGVDPNTIERTYGPALHRITQRIGHNRLETITPELVAAALADMRAYPYAPSTVRLSRRVLRMCLATADEWDRLPRGNPVKGRPPRAPERPVKQFDLTRARAIGAAVRDTPADLPVALGLYLGLRIGETLGLRWVDVTDDQIVVRGQLDEHGRYKPRTKTGRERALPLFEPVAGLLRGARVRQATERLAAGARYQASGHVVTGPLGRPLSRTGVRGPMQQALAAAGLEPVTFHDLRHMTATLLHDLGVSEEVRRSILGHASAEVHQLYVHVSREEQRRALEELARALAR
jgi:integrase